jgi:hypothetical protein
METSEEARFDVYVRTRSAMVILVRDVSLRTAHALARGHADTHGRPVFVRNTKTRAVETVAPSPLARRSA